MLYVQLVVQFRHGKEEDEVMGVSFKKELIIDRKQVYFNKSKRMFLCMWLNTSLTAEPICFSFSVRFLIGLNKDFNWVE